MAGHVSWSLQVDGYFVVGGSLIPSAEYLPGSLLDDGPLVVVSREGPDRIQAREVGDGGETWLPGCPPGAGNDAGSHRRWPAAPIRARSVRSSVLLSLTPAGCAAEQRQAARPWRSPALSPCSPERPPSSWPSGSAVPLPGTCRYRLVSERRVMRPRPPQLAHSGASRGFSSVQGWLAVTEAPVLQSGVPAADLRRALRPGSG